MLRPFVISAHTSHSLHGFESFGWRQLIAFARIRAVVVLPQPRPPQKMNACASRFVANAFFNVLVTCACPMTSSNTIGRHLRAVTW